MYRSGSGSKTGKDGRKVKSLIRGDSGSKAGKDGREVKA